MSEVARRRFPWTEREDNELRLSWGIHPLKEIATKLQRTPYGVYTRAYVLGLGLGCPQGFETLPEACARTGYGPTTLVTILNWARVPLRPWTSAPWCKHARRCVEPIAVDDAVAAWCQRETIRDGARRHNITYSMLVIWLHADVEAGLVEAPRRRRGTHWRLAPSVIDAVVARRRSVEPREPFALAAKRVGIAKRTLKRWLAEAGQPRPTTRYWPVDPAVVNQIVAEKKLTSTKAWRGRGRRVTAEGRAA